MHRIDGPGATAGNLFTEGDPETAVAPTEVTDDWANAVQEELAAVIEDDGTALDKPDNGQLVAAIKKLVSSVPPWISLDPIGTPFAPTGTVIRICRLTRTDFAIIDSSAAELLKTIRWNGGSWVQVGNALNIAGIGAPAITRLTDSTIAWYDGPSGNVRTYSFDGTNWTQVGNTLALAGIGGLYNICAMTATRICLTDSNNEKLTAYDWDGTDWTQVGNQTTITPGTFAYFQICRLNDTDVVEIDEANDRLTVWRFDGTDWAIQGNYYTITTGAQNPGLALLRENTIVHYDANADKFTVLQWDGTDFTVIFGPRDISAIGFGNQVELAPMTESDLVLVGTVAAAATVYVFHFHTTAVNDPPEV